MVRSFAPTRMSIAWSEKVMTAAGMRGPCTEASSKRMGASVTRTGVATLRPRASAPWIGVSFTRTGTSAAGAYGPAGRLVAAVVRKDVPRRLLDASVKSAGRPVASTGASVAWIDWPARRTDASLP